MMEIIEKINEIVKNLPAEGAETTLRKFSEIIAKSGQDLEKELDWGLSERNFEVMLETTKTIYALTWFYYLLNMLAEDPDEKLVNLGKARGLISHFEMIMKPILTSVLEKAKNQGKLFSR
ncbi:MAG: hypothetical protein ACXQS8_03055, partial [Candidatus Helarchaeales archaeon]